MTTQQDECSTALKLFHNKPLRQPVDLFDAQIFWFYLVNMMQRHWQISDLVFFSVRVVYLVCDVH